MEVKTRKQVVAILSEEDNKKFKEVMLCIDNIIKLFEKERVDYAFIVDEEASIELADLRAASYVLQRLRDTDGIAIGGSYEND